MERLMGTKFNVWNNVDAKIENSDLTEITTSYSIFAKVVNLAENQNTTYSLSLQWKEEQ